jgi:hypothetical protein
LKKRDAKALNKRSGSSGRVLSLKRSRSVIKAGPKRRTSRTPIRGKRGEVDPPKKRKRTMWVAEFTAHQAQHAPVGTHSALANNLNNQSLKRRRIFVNLIELQHYGGLALCSNHVVNFKIGELDKRFFLLTLMFLLIVSTEKDMLTDQNPQFFHPKFSH